MTLRRVLLETEYANALRRRGLQHAAQFNWRKTAAATLAVYERFERPAISRVNRMESVSLNPA